MFVLAVLLHETHRDLRGPPRVQAAIPETLSWKAYLTASSNQHVPKYCGACFAFAAFHTLQDRVKIARELYEDNYDAPDLHAAIQVMLNCGKETAGSCGKGGTAPGVWRWVRDFGGVPAAGCQPYEASDDYDCAPQNVCRNCMPGPTGEHYCWAVPGDRVDAQPCADTLCATSPYPRIAVADFGKLPSSDDVGLEAAVLAMQREIARAGPIACDIDAEQFLSYTSGVIQDPQGSRTNNNTDHVIEVIGWGEEDGLPYWIVRNSWGEYWGEAGFGKLYRGRNDALVESAGCYWVHPAGWGTPQAWQDYTLPLATTHHQQKLVVETTTTDFRPPLFLVGALSAVVAAMIVVKRSHGH